jgi:glycosyltransferase involved in cell wall biosynthesis
MHFSIITPTHNRRDFLPEAVASVRASVSAPLDFTLDHLICENASTDDTAAWLQSETGKEGVTLRVRPQSTKLLPGPARNLLCIIMLLRFSSTRASLGLWPIFCA